MAMKQKHCARKFKQQSMELYTIGRNAYPQLEREYGVNRSTLRGIEQVANFKGSRAEQRLMVFCKQSKLCCTKLKGRKQWLTLIVQKSELEKSYVLQRDKRKP